jgi:hypothetical protein
MVSMGTGDRGRPAGRTRAAVLASTAVLVAVIGAVPTIAWAAPVRSEAASVLSGGGRPAPDMAGDTAVHGMHRSTSNSLDWAGYAVTGTPVTSVAGSWVQPTATCPGTKLEQSAFWVGIDGFASTDPTVQQIGTDADCAKGSKKHPGGPVYYAWYEMFPGPLVVLSLATYPVDQGDDLSANITASGGTYVLTLVDAGHWTFSTTQVSATALNASAEWIAEAPTSVVNGKTKVVPLTQFGSVTFNGATVNGLPVNGSGLVTNQITMTKNKKGTIVEAAPSALSTAGTSFTITWLSL